MKLKDPGMMTPSWWVKNTRHLEINANDTATQQRYSLEGVFKTHTDKQGRITVAGTGKLTVQHSGDHDPDWRNQMGGMCGVQVGLAKEFVGKLWCLHTAKRIPVSRVDGNPPLWIDLEARTAMLCRGLWYDSPDGPPHPQEKHEINYSFPNKSEVTVFMARLMPILREAKTWCALLELEPEWNRPLILNLIETIYKNPHIVDASFGQHVDAQIRAMAWGVDRLACDKDFTDKIKDLCADHYTSPYLEYRP